MPKVIELKINKPITESPRRGYFEIICDSDDDFEVTNRLERTLGKPSKVTRTISAVFYEYPISSLK